MRIHAIYYIFLVAFLLVACATEPAPLPPGVPSLVSPANNEPCLDGVIISDTQSEVDFQWSTATNALNYILEVTNLETNQKQSFPTATNSKKISLFHAVPYQWRVIAIGEPETIPSNSADWKFFLASEPQVNYAPFPPDLTFPESAATVTPNNGTINVSWTANDLDNDIVRFDLYLDTEDGNTLVSELNYTGETTTVEVAVGNNQIYYWQVTAIDEVGNTSNSGIYSFRTQ